MAQALFGLGVIAGPAVGPVLGGWLTDNLGWRWIFFINLPLGIIAVWMCMVLFPRDEHASTRPQTSVDWYGIGYLTVGLAAFQIMLEEGQQDDWFSSHFILAMAIASVIGLGFFVHRELNTDHPAVDLRILRYPSMVGGSIYSAILGMGIYGIMFAVPIFVQDFLHFTALQSGEILRTRGDRLRRRDGDLRQGGEQLPPRLLICIGALLTACTGLHAYGHQPRHRLRGQLFWPLVLRGLGSVMMFMPLSIATLGPLPKKDIPAGAGFYSLTRQLGSSIGIALITTMLARREGIHRAVAGRESDGLQPAGDRPHPDDRGGPGRATAPARWPPARGRSASSTARSTARRPCWPTRTSSSTSPSFLSPRFRWSSCSARGPRPPRPRPRPRERPRPRRRRLRPLSTDPISNPTSTPS